MDVAADFRSKLRSEVCDTDGAFIEFKEYEDCFPCGFAEPYETSTSSNESSKRVLPERPAVDAGENNGLLESGVVCSELLLPPTGVRFTVCGGGVFAGVLGPTSIPRPRLASVGFD